jgi:hypothetical protein
VGFVCLTPSCCGGLKCLPWSVFLTTSLGWQLGGNSTSDKSKIRRWIYRLSPRLCVGEPLKPGGIQGKRMFFSMRGGRGEGVSDLAPHLGLFLLSS